MALVTLQGDVPIAAVVGSCRVLRDRVVAELLAGWQGPVQRGVDPAQLPAILLDLGTPNLFGEPSLSVCALDDKMIAKYQEQIANTAAQPGQGGQLLLLFDKLPAKRGDKLFPVLRERDAVAEVSSPDPRRMVDWLVEQMHACDQAVNRPRDVAEDILSHRGSDPDVALQTWETLRDFAGDEPVGPEHVAAMLSDVAESPVYEFTNAFVAGEARRCLQILYAGRGLAPEMALGAVANELRKMLACLEHEDDKEVYRRAGLRGRPGRGMYYVRKRASGLGRRCLGRLLAGVLQTQAKLRLTGTDPQLAMETLVLNVRRILQ